MSRDVWVVLGTLGALFLFRKFAGNKKYIPQGPGAANAGLTNHAPQAAPGNVSGTNTGTSFNATVDQSRNPANSVTTWAKGPTLRRVARLQAGNTVNY